MYSIIRPFLFLLPAETAHHFTLFCLKLLARIGVIRPPNYNLAQAYNVMGLHLPNRIGAAAGLDRNGDYIDALACFGFGFIEVGTITPNPVVGNPRPRMFRIVKEEAIINRMGFANAGLEYSVSKLKKIKYKGILGINIGKNPTTPNEDAVNDYLTCFRALWPYANYITLNISSPNTVGLRELQHREQLSELLIALKKEQALIFSEHKKYVPIAVKIAPDLTKEQVIEIANVLLQEKVDGVIATNTSIQRPLPANTAKADEKGGLSGKPLHPLSMQVIQQLREVLQNRIPIIGCGGTIDKSSAQEKLAAGASLLQVYTGFVYRGPRLVKELILM